MRASISAAMRVQPIAQAFVARLCLIVAATALLWLATPEAFAKEQRVLIDTRESLYNKIFIYGDGDLVYMTFGLNKALFVESAANTKDELELPAPYTRFMTAGLAYARNLTSVLEIGSGGGRTAWYLHRSLPDLSIASVEIDPVVIELAHRYFGIKDEPNFNLANEDGRQFLTHSPQRYDIILLDAYHGPFIPFHLLTNEFYGLVKAHLAEGGVVLQNLDPSTALFDSVLKTMRASFAQTDLFVADENVVIAAYDGEPRSKEDLMALAETRQSELKLRYALPGLIGERRPIDQPDKAIDPSAKILTDDFAPVDALKAIEKHNRQWPSLSTGR